MPQPVSSRSALTPRAVLVSRFPGSGDDDAQRRAFDLLGSTIAACADANPSAPGVPVQRWLEAILLRARFAPRADKISPMPLRALDWPAFWVRSGFCIGCDLAAHSQRRSTHEHQTLSPRLRRDKYKRRAGAEELLAGSRRCLAAQDRQGLRRCDPRGDHRLRSHRLHRAQGQIVRRVSRPGQGASVCILPHFLFLLPRPAKADAPMFGATHPHCTAGTFRQRNAISFAARLILRFIRRMIPAVKSVSKLCADKPRHVPVSQPSVFCRHSTWQGGGDPLRCILPLCRKRHPETLPVSIPSGLRSASSPASRLVQP